MAIFNRKKKQQETTVDENGKVVEKKKTKRPANTAFKQQRLKAWQPILTPKTVIPILFIIGIIFAPIGGLLLWGSNQVTEITLDYTNCDSAAPTDGTNGPIEKFNYQLSTGHSSVGINHPTWSFSNDSTREVGKRAVCNITFEVPYDLKSSVFLYYKLTNYYQNHRRYVQSVDTSQLKGNFVSLSSIDSGQCKPITSMNGIPYYPCGLIANSVFNDTFPSVTLRNPSNGESSQIYNFSEKGIAWSGEAKKYTNTPYGQPSDYLPPPNWALRYPNGYTSFPPLADDEHFQVWMRTAALPTFKKLWGRNDVDTMSSGTYSIEILMNYPVKQFGGTKSIVISTVAWIGGKNTFLGWSYVAAAALCFLLALVGTVRHMVKPRRMGDMSLLSWNQPQPAGK